MPNVIYDNLEQLPESGMEARLELTGGLAVIEIALQSETESKAGIKASATQRIQIGAAGSVIGHTYGLQFLGNSSSVYNEGLIESLSQTHAAIFFSGGTNIVTNWGTIKAKGIVIQGGNESDRIVNANVLETTSNAVLLDLGGGNDFYDGTLGRANGGSIKLGSGNDTAYGGAFSEIFVGGTGDDYLYGGGGSDTADYSDATDRLVIDLNKTSAQSLGDQGTDTLMDIENLIGGAVNDTLIGNSTDNTLQGRGGHDELVGGLGNDVLEGGEGNDTLDGGSGDDVLHGGNGTNTARYSSSTAATVDLRKTGGQNTGYGSDTLSGIVNLEGGSGNDTFIGNDDANRLDGKGGNDTLTGGGGDDTLDGGSGINTLEGGAGNDTLIGTTTGQNTAVFAGTRAEYEISPKNLDGTYTVTDKHTTPRDGVDTLMNVRLLKFSDQTIALTNSNPTYEGSTSMVVSESRKAGDTFGYLSSKDTDGDTVTYSLDSASSSLFGVRSGQYSWEIYLKKAVDYEKATQHKVTITVKDPYGGSSTKAVTVFVQNVIETTPIVRNGTAKTDQLVGESGNDKLFGLGGDDRLFGQIGNDLLNGGTGNDAFNGGVGNDTLIGGTGSDVLFGDKGKDVFVFDQALSVKSNLDYIQDFTPVDDVIHLSRAIFSKIAKGTLSSKAFVTGNQFKDKDDRILYLKDQGALFYDPDGSGSAKAIQFANLSKNLALKAADFYIV